jgi:Rieske [2Fe-2S] domain
MFLRSYWYAAAWDGDSKHAPFARTVCGEPIVVYRQPIGNLSAFEDCCPHRLLLVKRALYRATIWSASITDWSSTSAASASGCLASKASTRTRISGGIRLRRNIASSGCGSATRH